MQSSAAELSFEQSIPGGWPKTPFLSRNDSVDHIVHLHQQLASSSDLGPNHTAESPFSNSKVSLYNKDFFMHQFLQHIVMASSSLKPTLIDKPTGSPSSLPTTSDDDPRNGPSFSFHTDQSSFPFYSELDFRPLSPITFGSPPPYFTSFNADEHADPSLTSFSADCKPIFLPKLHETGLDSKTVTNQDLTDDSDSQPWTLSLSPELSSSFLLSLPSPTSLHLRTNGGPCRSEPDLSRARVDPLDYMTPTEFANSVVSSLLGESSLPCELSLDLLSDVNSMLQFASALPSETVPSTRLSYFTKARDLTFRYSKAVKSKLLCSLPSSLRPSHTKVFWVRLKC